MLTKHAIDQAAIRAFILQKEQEATAAKTRAEVAEATLLQKDLEVAAATQREEAMRTTIESMRVRPFSSPPSLSSFVQGIFESDRRLYRPPTRNSVAIRNQLSAKHAFATRTTQGHFILTIVSINTEYHRNTTGQQGSGSLCRSTARAT